MNIQKITDSLIKVVSSSLCAGIIAVASQAQNLCIMGFLYEEELPECLEQK